MLVDTHSHLYTEEFSQDVDAVLNRAREAGVGKIFLPNINGDTILPMIHLASANPGFLYPMLGLHPEDIGQTWQNVLPSMERMLSNPDHPFIGIGEVGLDYYWDRSQYSEQQEAFAIQVRWAMKYHLPLMIHTRAAHREMVDILQEETGTGAHQTEDKKSETYGKCLKPELTGVFHCFGGTADEAEELLHFDGFCLGIGGVVTFKKSPLPEVLRAVVPLSRIVLETDSPYLAPVPHRGKRNESVYVTEVAKRLAEIYDVTVQKVTEITTTNALRTFPRAQ